MLVLIGVVTAVALVLMILGFWKADLVIWFIDTILWLVWTYMVFNQANTTGLPDNSYIPTALGVLGAGLVLVCIYKDFSIILSVLRSRRGPPPPSYDEEKETLRRHIYDITHRRYP